MISYQPFKNILTRKSVYFVRIRDVVVSFGGFNHCYDDRLSRESNLHATNSGKHRILSANEIENNRFYTTLFVRWITYTI